MSSNSKPRKAEQARQLTAHNGNDDGVSFNDFYAYMPMHAYIFAPSLGLWPAASVNARLPPVIGPDGKQIPPSRWLDQNRPVEQMTWAPGGPQLILDRVISEGGFIEEPGKKIFNLYRPPTITPVRGDVTPWRLQWPTSPPFHQQSLCVPFVLAVHECGSLAYSRISRVVFGVSLNARAAKTR